MATIKDVAQLAQVSTATVSRYFQSNDVVSPSTQLRIKQAVQELNYSPNSIASMLKSSRTNIVGLIVSDVNNVFFSYLIQALNVSLSKLQKRLIVLYSDPNGTVSDQLRALLSLRAEAAIFIPSKPSRSIEQLMNNVNCYPLQLFVDCFEKFDSLVVDDAYGTRLAAEELLGRGHRRILMLDTDNAVYRHRREGFLRAFREAGVPFSEEFVLALDTYDYISRHEEIAEAIRRVRPTAILSVTNNLTQNVVCVLRKLGLEIPRNVSLVMYDESDWAVLNDYTTITHPMEEMTNLIQTILPQNLYKPGAARQPFKRSVRPKLIRRGSVAPPKN